MRSKLVVVLGFFLFSSVAYSQNCLKEGFLPPNNERIPFRTGFAFNIDNTTFNAVIDKVEAVYSPIFASKGAKLVFERLWNNSEVNAQARQEGTNWIVSMYGGLARHPELTNDGLLLIACHEVGHHVGGAPKYPGQWASNEGQSDYFAATKCMRKVLAADDNETIAANLNAPQSVVNQCNNEFSDKNLIGICIRSAMAGYSAAKMMFSVSGGTGGAPDFLTPDRSQVNQTFDNHPAGQCRLDTYYAAASCYVSDTIEIGSSDPTIGACSEENGDPVGFRPRCWYRPASGTSPTPTPIPTPTPTPIPTPIPGAANTPTVSGMTQVLVTNPYQSIVFEYDVSNAVNAGGAYVEVSYPNQTFSNPNGNRPDRVHLYGYSQKALRNSQAITPIMHLPGWGVYSIRVIAITSQGQPSGRFSNPLQIYLRPF